VIIRNELIYGQTNLEEKLFGFADAFTFEDAPCIQNSLRFGIWDLPNGPEPGPEMPKRRKPSIN
jgi:hypothetical protein